MGQLQELLGKILKGRIEREKADGTLEADKTNISETLDIFMASNKITSEQYAEFTELITPTTEATNSEVNKTTETTTQA